MTAFALCWQVVFGLVINDSATRLWGSLTGGAMLVAGLIVMLAGQIGGGRPQGSGTPLSPRRQVGCRGTERGGQALEPRSPRGVRDGVPDAPTPQAHGASSRRSSGILQTLRRCTDSSSAWSGDGGTTRTGQVACARQ